MYICQHGKLNEPEDPLSTPCQECLGPSDRGTPGAGEVAWQCPRCPMDTGAPSFSTDMLGFTVTTITCRGCGYQEVMG